MDAFHRLLRFGGAAKERALSAWRAAVLRSAPALRWLKLQFERGLQWLRLRPRVVFWAGGISIALALILGFIIGGGASWYAANAPAIAPLLTLVAGVSVAAVALIRHFAQTDADRQRRITESFSKAVEQLGSDKLEVRLGGIYSLERISKESPDDYWTVMENLTAFVRERSRRNEVERTSHDLEQRVSRRAYFLWLRSSRRTGALARNAVEFWEQALKDEERGEPPVSDIAAVLTVILRRKDRQREAANNWCLDLSGAILKRANLAGCHLAGANLQGARFDGAAMQGARLDGANMLSAYFDGASLSEAHLEGANLGFAHLEGASLDRAHMKQANFQFSYLKGATFRGAQLDEANFFKAQFEGASLDNAHLVGTILFGANLEGADLRGADLTKANLEDARLYKAYLKETNLEKARLEGADLRGAHLEGAQLLQAFGNVETQLPVGMARPAHWPDTAKPPSGTP
jgi:uncharacterized protein YjbI with pentapeptide repeats